MSLRRSPRVRLLATVAALFATTVATAVVSEPVAHAATSQTFAVGTVVGEAPDFATSVWADKWDFSNGTDAFTDAGPAAGVLGPRWGGGVLSYTITGHSYVTPLWGGYPGSLYLGRDGVLPGNQINVNTFTRFHLHAYVSRETRGVFWYFTCTPPTSRCQGGPAFTLRAGWNDIDMPVRSANRPTGPLAQGLRLALNATAPTLVQLDFLRVYRPSAASLLTWASPAKGTPAQLYWSDGAAYPTGSDRHGGPVVGVGGQMSVARGGTATVDVSGYPAGTRFYAVSSNGVVTPAAESVAITPLPAPVIDSPSVAGCGDYATAALGHPWRFTSPRTLAGWGNIARLRFTGGYLTATNAGARRNDPYVLLPLGRGGIDGRKWHHLTVVEGYDGRFDLRDAPGGGTMARILWGAAGNITLAQTNDLVTYSGTRTITVDLGMPAARLTEPDGSAAQRYPFASATRITRLRWDPNEDRGSRTWHLYSVRLAADCATKAYTYITWHDTQFTPGSQATVIIRDARGRDYTIARVAEVAGKNSALIRARWVPAGKYSVRVVVTNAAGMGRATASGPLYIQR